MTLVVAAVQILLSVVAAGSLAATEGVTQVALSMQVGPVAAAAGVFALVWTASVQLVPASVAL